MCRLYGFRANEQTKVECTLVRAQNALLLQSRRDQRGIGHPDGWGIGFYADGEPTVERRATAAHTDLNFAVTTERTFSRTVIAHVRKATVGQPQVANTHPFSHGRWLFAHNGTMTGFDDVHHRLEAEIPATLLQYRLGATDSELIFYWLLSRLLKAGATVDTGGDEEHLRTVVARSVVELAAWCEEAQPEAVPRLNFLLTDGVTMAATRWNNSLWWVERREVHDCEICGIPHIRHTPSAPYRAAVIASEPISHEEWQEIPDHSILVIDPEMRTITAL